MADAKRETPTKKPNVQKLDLKSTEPSFGFPKSSNLSKDEPGTDRNMINNIFSKDSQTMLAESQQQFEAFEAGSTGQVATARGFNYFAGESQGSPFRRRMTDELDNPRRATLKPEKPPTRIFQTMEIQDLMGTHGGSALSKSLNESRIDHLQGGHPLIMTPKNVSSFIDMLDYSLSEADVSHFRHRDDGVQGLNTSLSMSRIKVPPQDQSMQRFRGEGGDTTRDLIVETFGANSFAKDNSIHHQRKNSNTSQISNTTLNNTSMTCQNAIQLDERMLDHPLCKFAGLLPPKKIKHSTKLVIQKEYYPEQIGSLDIPTIECMEHPDLEQDGAEYCLPRDDTREKLAAFQVGQHCSQTGKANSDEKTRSVLHSQSSQRSVVPFLDWTSTCSDKPSKGGQLGGEIGKGPEQEGDNDLQDLLQIMLDDQYLTSKKSTAKKKESSGMQLGEPVLGVREQTERESVGLQAARRLVFVPEEIAEVTEGSNSATLGGKSEEESGQKECFPVTGLSPADGQDGSRSELNLQTISNIEQEDKPDSHLHDQSGSLVLESDGSIL